jgi:hypothetical protein
MQTEVVENFFLSQNVMESESMEEASKIVAKLL